VYGVSFCVHVWQLLLSRFVLYAKQNFAMMAIQGMVGSNDRDDEKHTEQVRSLGWMTAGFEPHQVTSSHSLD